MADEIVSIKLKVDAHDRQLTQVIAKLKALEAVEKRLASGSRMQNYAKNQSSALNSMTKGWKRHFDAVDAGIKMMGKGLSGFLKMAIKGVVIEMGLLGASMIAVHGVFVAGQLIMKAYRGAMQLLSGAAAGTVVAIAAVSAAIREQQAAIYAYRGKGAKEFGSAMSQTRMAMRALQADASLATLGVDALNQAYGVMSTTMNSRQIAGSTGALKALMDFGSAGQDPAKGLQSVAAVVQALNDPKKGMSAVRAEAKKLGPEMEKALKAANVQTKQQFSELLYSGELARLGGVEGQFGAINSTLIGQLKSYMTQMRTVFADFGDQFLEPLKVAFSEIFHILKRDIARIMGAVQITIGTDGYIDGFVSMIDKTSNWMVKMIREYLPKAVGMFDRIGEWMNDFQRGWNNTLDYLRPLIDGARVLYRALNPVWEAIKGGADNLFLMKDLLVANADNVEEFGERLGGFITALSQLFMNLKMMFFDILPLINDMISGLTQVFKLLSNLLTGFAGKGLTSALAPLLAFAVAGRAMQGVKGRLMPGAVPFKQNMMNVQAGVVNINGPGGPVGGAGPTGLSSGGRPGSGAGPVFASGAQYGPALPPGSMRLGDLKSQHGMTRGALMREGVGAATRNMNYQSIMAGGNAIIAGRPGFLSTLAGGNRGIGMSYADSLGLTPFERNQMSATQYQRRADLRQGAMNSFRNLGTRAQQGAAAANYRARQGFGAFRGLMGYANTGVYDRSMGAYVDIGATRDAYRQALETDIANDTAASPMKKRMMRLRGAIDQNRITRSYTKFGAGVNKFQGSFGGKMGTSLGLGLASQFAPEEMRGAMAVGGMVGQFNPLLGLGVAGLGGAMNAQSAGSGFLAGAGGGAALGAKFGPYGALIGGTLGGIFGAWRGVQNKAKAEVQAAKQFAQETIGEMYSSIAGAAGRKLSEFEATLAAGEKITPGTAGAFQNVAGEMYSQGQRLLGQIASPNISRYQAAGDTLKNKLDSRYATALRDLEKSGQLTTEEAMRVRRRSGNSGNQAARELEKMAQEQVGGGRAEEILRELYRNQGLYGVEITAEDMKEKLKRPEVAIVEMQETLVKNSRGLLAVQSQNTARMDMLTKMSGKTAPELELLAKEIGFDLYDATLDFSDVVKKLGLAVVKSSEQFKFAMQDAFLAGSDIFKKSVEQREGEKAVDQAAAALNAVLMGGGSIEEKNLALEQTMADYFPQMLAAAGGDPIAAFLNTQTLFGQGPTGGAFAPGMAYAGQGEFFAQNESFQAMLEQQKTAIPQVAAEQLAALVYSKTGMAMDVGTLIPQIGQMAPEKLNTLLTALSTLDQKTINEQGLETNILKTGITPEATESTLMTLLSGMGISNAGFIKAEGDVNAVSDAMAGLTDSQKTLGISIDTLKGVVETLNTNFKEFFEGDTRTPRGGQVGDTATSRLSQTMARHAGLDSQLTGKRTITSAYRTWGLGSPSSDHATGRAYDLTGQNLGQYAKLVHANGGFAEFHGAAANRHLHVVPGPGIGDTATMRATVGASSGGGSTTNYYNFEINGTGFDPEAVAQMVMMKIKETERVNRERS